MKGQNYILKIKEPCLKDWDLMKPNETGKFCSHCSKTVVDFSRLSDQQIIDFLQQKSSSTCIRLTARQQNRVLIPSQVFNHTPKLYKFFSALLLIGTTQQSMATNKVAPGIKVESVDSKEKEAGLNTSKVKNEFGTLKIRLLDKTTNEAIPFASIRAYQDNVQVGLATTDMDGEAVMKLLKPGKYSVRGLYVGYQATEVIDVLVSEDKITCLIIPLAHGEGINLDEVKILTYQVCKDLQPLTVSNKDIQNSENVYVIGPYEGQSEPEPIRAVEKQKAKKWWQFRKKKSSN